MNKPPTPAPLITVFVRDPEGGPDNYFYGFIPPLPDGAHAEVVIEGRADAALVAHAKSALAKAKDRVRQPSKERIEP
jgi:hypothetical protein